MSAADDVLLGGPGGADPSRRGPAVVDVTDRALARSGPPAPRGPRTSTGMPRVPVQSGRVDDGWADDCWADDCWADPPLEVPYLPDAPWLHVELDRAGSPPRRSARVRHRVLLVGLMLADAAGLGVGWSVSVLSPDPRWRAAEPGGLAVTALLAAVPVWWAAIAGAGGYPARYRAPGTPGHGRFADGAVRFAATAMVVTALALPDSARGVALALPAALLTALVLRLSWVRLGDLAVGAGGRRVLVVGSAVAAASVVCRLSDNRSQLQVVGRCAWERIGGEEGAPAVDGYGVEGADVIRRRVTAAARAARADLVLVADAAALPADGIRRLAWSLEGTGLGLLVATGLSDVATSRLRVHLAAGLPLLAVDEPALTGAPRVIKEVVDRVGAAVLLVLLAPLMLLVAAAVRLADPGPAVFRQERVGRHGQRFTMYTFRSMRVNAEGWRPALETLNDDRSRGGGATLFTMRGDPRVTTLGRLLRRSSLDELPQLLNVLRGEMSLVGPRPPLLAEVERYQTQALRRLRVKPGLTGLWQVSGRADLDCDESLRLDLSYVENWSVGMDLRILARTPLAVMGGRGAR